jgi:hypothetical protein
MGPRFERRRASLRRDFTSVFGAAGVHKTAAEKPRQKKTKAVSGHGRNN